jgi:hypothetical protein
MPSTRDRRSPGAVYHVAGAGVRQGGERRLRTLLWSASTPNGFDPHCGRPGWQAARARSRDAHLFYRLIALIAIITVTTALA